MKKAVQAKHLPTHEVLAMLTRHPVRPPDRATPEWLRRIAWEIGASAPASPPVWLIWDVERYFPSYPAKVVAAKMHQLIRNGLVDGCDCGCRGDFTLTEKGRAYLAERAVTWVEVDPLKVEFTTEGGYIVSVREQL